MIVFTWQHDRSRVHFGHRRGGPHQLPIPLAACPTRLPLTAIRFLSPLPPFFFPVRPAGVVWGLLLSIEPLPAFLQQLWPSTGLAPTGCRGRHWRACPRTFRWQGVWRPSWAPLPSCGRTAVLLVRSVPSAPLAGSLGVPRPAFRASLRGEASRGGRRCCLGVGVWADMPSRSHPLGRQGARGRYARIFFPFRVLFG